MAYRGDFLLGDAGHSWSSARERCEDDQLRSAVGLGHRRGVRLQGDVEAGA